MELVLQQFRPMAQADPVVEESIPSCSSKGTCLCLYFNAKVTQLMRKTKMAKQKTPQQGIHSNLQVTQPFGGLGVILLCLPVASGQVYLGWEAGEADGDGLQVAAIQRLSWPLFFWKVDLRGCGAPASP